MDQAKKAVTDFMSRSGKHDTTVHEAVNPHVQHETVNEIRKEERQAAIDREIHQDHYHTSVQPIQDREVLPEQHHHNLVPVEHRTHDHRDLDDTKRKIELEQAQFRDQTVRAPTQHQSTTVPTIAGEHIHHHVHETIQPIVQKETIEPHVVHTTIPIHEVHHNAAQHHSASALPAMSMAEFKQHGGSLHGREERTDHFAGEPKNIDRALGAVTGSHSTTHGTSSGPHNSSLLNKADPRIDSDRDGRADIAGIEAPGSRSHGTTGHGTLDPRVDSSSHSGATGSGLGHSTSGTSSTTHAKPSLLDKLNPMKDSDGDGKKGFMK